MIDVIVQVTTQSRPVIAQRLDNKRFITLNWDADNWTKGDMAEAEQSSILSEHDTIMGALEKIDVQPTLDFRIRHPRLFNDEKPRFETNADRIKSRDNLLDGNVREMNFYGE